MPKTLLEEWPIGMTVQRKNTSRGAPPYRFRGEVCGHYRNPETGQLGVVVSSFAEPGCCQIFPVEQMEPVDDRS